MGRNNQAKAMAFPETVRLELDRIASKEAGLEIRNQLREYAYAATSMIQQWLLYHHQRGTRDCLIARENIGPCIVGSLEKAMYRTAVQRLPRLHSQCRSYLLQWVCKTLRSKTSSKFSGKMWTNIILGRENPPTFEALPLRLDKTNGRIERRGDRLWLVASVLCDPPPKGRKRRVSRWVEFRLRKPTKSKSKAGSTTRANYRFAEEIADGERRFSCSQLSYTNGKWYLFVPVEKERPQYETDENKTAIVRPGRSCAWRLRVAAGSGSWGATMLARVGELRAEIIRRRQIKRALIDSHPGGERGPVQKSIYGRLRGRWNRYCTTLNQQAVSELSQKILEYGYGRVIVYDGDNRCALASVGREESRRDPTIYPFAQFRTLLKQKLEPHGVIVSGRSDFRSVKRRLSRGAKRVAAQLVQEGGV